MYYQLDIIYKSDTDIIYNKILYYIIELIKR